MCLPSPDFMHTVLDHIGHARMSKMKALARTVIWWPKLDMDIKKMIKGSNKMSIDKTDTTSGSSKSSTLPT